MATRNSIRPTGGRDNSVARLITFDSRPIRRSQSLRVRVFEVYDAYGTRRFRAIVTQGRLPAYVGPDLPTEAQAKEHGGHKLQELRARRDVAEQAARLSRHVIMSGVESAVHPYHRTEE